MFDVEPSQRPSRLVSEDCRNLVSRSFVGSCQGYPASVALFALDVDKSFGSAFEVDRLLYELARLVTVGRIDPDCAERVRAGVRVEGFANGRAI